MSRAATHTHDPSARLPTSTTSTNHNSPLPPLLTCIAFLYALSRAIKTEFGGSRPFARSVWRWYIHGLGTMLTPPNSPMKAATSTRTASNWSAAPHRTVIVGTSKRSRVGCRRTHVASTYGDSSCIVAGGSRGTTYYYTLPTKPHLTSSIYHMIRWLASSSSDSHTRAGGRRITS